MKLRLAGKSALVTGSSSGIGAAIAIRLAQEGANVAVNYRKNLAGANQTLKRVEAAGVRAIVLQADVSNVSEVQDLIRSAMSALGALDVLVNNAGIEISQPFTKVDEASYDRVLDVNLKGPFFATQAFARALIEAERPGRVINISSIHEDLPFPRFASYCASKGGLRMLTRNLAIELAPHRINVNSVAPGAILTPINASLLENPFKLDKLVDEIPLHRLGSPDDVAGTVAFLASSDADYITGTTLFVDGGLMWNYQEEQ